MIYYEDMRITVEIDAATMTEIMELTSETKKGPAIYKAVVEYAKRKKAKEFGRLIREGTFDYEFTNEEVEKMGLGDGPH